MLQQESPFSDEDTHLVLAALRFIQASLPQLPEEFRAIMSNEGEVALPEDEQLQARLDQLCEHLNLGYKESH